MHFVDGLVVVACLLETALAVYFLRLGDFSIRSLLGHVRSLGMKELVIRWIKIEILNEN